MCVERDDRGGASARAVEAVAVVDLFVAVVVAVAADWVEVVEQIGSA